MWCQHSHNSAGIRINLSPAGGETKAVQLRLSPSALWTGVFHRHAVSLFTIVTTLWLRINALSTRCSCIYLCLFFWGPGFILKCVSHTFSMFDVLFCICRWRMCSHEHVLHSDCSPLDSSKQQTHIRGFSFFCPRQVRPLSVPSYRPTVSFIQVPFCLVMCVFAWRSGRDKVILCSWTLDPRLRLNSAYHSRPLSCVWHRVYEPW